MTVNSWIQLFLKPLFIPRFFFFQYTRQQVPFYSLKPVCGGSLLLVSEKALTNAILEVSKSDIPLLPITLPLCLGSVEFLKGRESGYVRTSSSL